jgi:hypothetical protein
MVAKRLVRGALLVFAFAVVMAAGTASTAGGVGCAECDYYEEMALCVWNGDWEQCHVYVHCGPQGENCFEYCHLQYSCFWV